MANSFITPLPALCFSSEIPDIAMKVTTPAVNIRLRDSNGIFFTNTMYPHADTAVLFDIAPLLEARMKFFGISFINLTVEMFTDAEGKENFAAVSAAVLYQKLHFNGNTDIFLENCFLTALSSKRTSPKARNLLAYYAPRNSVQKIRYYCSYIMEGYDAVQVVSFDDVDFVPDADGVYQISSDCESLKFRIENLYPGKVEKILSYSVCVNKRSFIYYIHDFNPNLSFWFRNCFNVWELAELRAETSNNTELSQSFAVLNSSYTLYDKREERTYRVRSSALSDDEFRWLEQFLISDEIRILDNSVSELIETVEDFPRILITDIGYEISDGNDAANELKFSWKYENRRLRFPFSFFDIKEKALFAEQYCNTFD